MNISRVRENKKMLLAIIFILFAIILSSSIIVMELLYFDKQAEMVALHNAVNKTKERESFIDSYIDKASQNLIALRASKFFQDYLKSQDDEMTLELFMTHMKSQADLMQVRYIDQSGIEVIKIERRVQGGIPKQVEYDQLQDKSDRYYFIESQNRRLEEVWFSAIDLNVEDKQVESPQKPTIRAILPIEVNGEFGGIVIINYFAEALIEQLTYTPLYDMILCDNKGYVLYHYESRLGNDKKNWGNSLEHAYHINKEFPMDYPSVLSTQVYETNSFVSRQLDLPVYDGLILILQLRESYLVEEEQRSYREYLTIIGIVTVFSLLLTYFIIRFLSNILLNMDKVQKLNNSLGVATEIAKIGFWEFDAKTNIIKWSDGVYKIFGFKDQNKEMTFDLFLSLLPEEDTKMIREELTSSIEKKKDYFITHRLTTEDNQFKIVEERAEHYYDKDGIYTHSIGSIYDITDKYETERKYEYLLDNASDGVHILDKRGNLVEFSHSFAKNLGYSDEEMSQLTVYDWEASIPKEDLVKIIESLIEEPKTFETLHYMKNGQTLCVQINAKGIVYNGEKHLYASQRDMSEIKRVQKELENSKKRWQFAVEGNKDGLWDWNVDTAETFFSKQCRVLLGYKESELKNTIDEWRGLVHPDDISEMVNLCEEYLKSNETSYVHEHRMLRKDGSYLWIRDRGIVIEENDDGSPHRIIGTITDITDHKIAVGLLKEQTYLDELTGLHNRKAYNERIEELLEQYKRYNVVFSMIMLDIDDFKTINDQYGHMKGDDVLKEIATIFKANMRKNDYCFRIGGEEFIILTTGSSGSQAAELAEKVRLSIRDDSDVLTEYKHTLSVSLGVVTVHKDDTVETVYKRADKCMYIAKTNGKDRLVME